MSGPTRRLIAPTQTRLAYLSDRQNETIFQHLKELEKFKLGVNQIIRKIRPAAEILKNKNAEWANLL